MCTLHYLCSYTQSDLGRRIITQPSGVTKIDYIKSALKKAGYTVNILSLSEGDFEHPFFIYKSLTIKIDKAETLKFISTFCRSKSRICNRLLLNILQVISQKYGLNL